MELATIEMRLDSLEQKMAEVHKLTQILPRLEERMINQKDDLSDHERRLRALEEKQNKGGVLNAWIEKGFFILLGSLVPGLMLLLG
jgi:SMC interacting uncharacterized protein involved in chromosome segregation